MSQKVFRSRAAMRAGKLTGPPHCGRQMPSEKDSTVAVACAYTKKNAPSETLLKTRDFERTAHRAALLPNLVVACFAVPRIGLPGRRVRRRPGPASQELT